jgi:lipopolysaccharide/colanic/teichoic acid biosynthesis glycosyltransferase
MSIDAEQTGGARWAVPYDSRVTVVGNWLRNSRIDELPQVINVLKGEMSFVGPRPERPEFVEELVNEIPFYDLRHRVNPGITGWAQICYPYGASLEDAKDKLEYDLYYIKNYSLFLDLMILIQTAQVILGGKGAR